jgi:uncharacterized protein (DUF58 family)
VRGLPTPLTAALLALGLLPPLLLGAGGLAATAAWDGLVAAAFLIDLLLAPGPGSLRATRAFRDPLSAFAANRISLRVENAGTRPLRVELADAPPPSFDAAGHRWRARLAPRATLERAYEAVPRERGTVSFGDLHVRGAGPIGLAARQWRVPLARDARVYPDLRALALRAPSTDAEARRHRRRGAREGREFESLRPYLPGDDVRAIDWKATARRGAPIVRRWQPERNQILWLLLDCGRLLSGRLPDGRTKLDRAVEASLAIARAATVRGDRVGALLFGADVQRVVLPGAGRTRLGPLADALHAARATAEASDYAAAFDALDARQRRRALVVVFTDLADPDTSALLIARAAQLRRRHLVLVAAPDDSAVAEVARAVPATVDAAFSRVAAQRILAERDAAVLRLAAAGVRVESCAAADLAAASVARYAEIKDRGEL